MSDWLPSKNGDEWQWHHDSGLRLLIANIIPEKRTLPAWCELHWDGTAPPHPGVLVAGSKNLMGANTARDLAKVCKDRLHVKDVDWDHLLTQAVYDVVRSELDGPDMETLAAVPVEATGFLIRPLLGVTRPTSIVGPGGTYKSMLALAAAATVATGEPAWLGMKVMARGPVIYVDYEADAPTHSMRLNALAAGHQLDPPGPELQYVQAQGLPLASWAPALRKKVDQVGAVMVVIDSVMLARGGEASAADNIAFFAALASLGCSSLLVDHKSWEKSRSGEVGAFGSVVNHNSIGLSWEAKGSGNGLVTLFPGKNNNFAPGRLTPIGLQFDAETDSHERMITATWTLLEHLPRIGMEGQSKVDVIRRYVENCPGGVEPAEIAKALDMSTNHVRSALSKLVGRGELERIDGRYLPLAPPY